MADLSEIQASQSVKIAGANPSTGVEDNYMEVDTSGNAKVITTSAGPVVPGTVATNSDLIGGQFNSTLPSLTNTQQSAIQLDLNGRLLTSNSMIDCYKATYAASIVGLVPAATPTDVFTITGSATKTIRITRIEISGTQNTSATRDILILKRSTANSGGTFTSPANVPYDSNSAAGTAVVRAYTVNPASLGSLVGAIRGQRFQLLAANVTNPIDRIFWEFGNRPSQAVVLRGTSEVLAINLNSITSSSNLFDLDIEWTEES